MIFCNSQDFLAELAYGIRTVSTPKFESVEKCLNEKSLLPH